MFDHQASRIRRITAGVPAERRTAGERTLDRDRAFEVLALDVLGNILVMDPAPAMACNLVALFDTGLGELRMPLHRHRHREHGQRQAATFELAQDAPAADAGAIFVDRLHTEVAIGITRGADDLGQELLRTAVAMQDAILAALLNIQHELHGDAGISRPACLGWIAAVADQIAWIRGIGHGASVAIARHLASVQSTAIGSTSSDQRSLRASGCV